jgi:hypothetical protein
MIVVHRKVNLRQTQDNKNKKYVVKLIDNNGTIYVQVP